MSEIWKSVAGWRGFYEVSDQIRIRSLARTVARGTLMVSLRGRILKQTVTRSGYLTVSFSQNGVDKNVFVHRLIGLTFIDPLWEYDFDHINGNTLDNRIANLRPATRGQNCMNRKKMANTSSIFKGVHFHKQRNNWRSRIMVNYKRIHLGSYPTQEEAALAYNKAAIKHFGEFAKLNEIKE